MEHHDGTRMGVTAARPPGRGSVAHDRRWSADLHHSARCACVLLGMLLLVDGSAGTLTWWRGVMWAALALLLFLVLLPARVSAGDGWLASRRLLRTRRIRTDLLVAARPLDGVARRLVLRDALGARVEIDPEVLLRNPCLWYHLAEGVRASEASGTLLCGTAALHRLAERIDRETALAVFRVSDLE
ncbi:hypothetical protein AQJ66_07370 [Streptomyces bungoensis]|uniref:Uncharacterized protein n=1 Tax=Streptomyces bungoensis TaxID=285568 RepID=A0A101T9R3_9ACTN|nr:hypothetical protein [Streptomyces bungoensis]KUN88417.1 hypothetical protein AQJ66_07370 [Streptomyces bungoensis]